MKTKDFVFLGVLSFIVALSSTVAYAGHGSKSHYGGLSEKFFHKVHFILDNQEELSLSEEQIQSIKDLKLGIKKEKIRVGADIDIVGLDIYQALYGHTVDVAAVNSLIEQKYQHKISKAKLFAGGIADLKGILSEEQYGKLKELYRKGSS